MAYQNGPKIITDGLVLCLDAGNPKSYTGSGTTWTDLSRNSNNGTLTNGPTFNSDGKGSIVFDGTDDYVSVAQQPSLVNAGQFTLSAWMKRRLSNSKVICYQGATITNDVAFELWDDGNAYFEIGNGSNSFGYVSNNSIQWQQLIMVFDGSQTGNSNRLKAYINGTLQTLTYSQTIPSTTGLSNSVFSIGNSQGIGGNFSDGSIAQVSIYNRGLSAAEILQNYNATKGRFKL
jgi:hypothetical protein